MFCKDTPTSPEVIVANTLNIIIIIIIGEIPDAGHWVLYAQILIVRDGAPPCNKNEQAVSSTLYPGWIQTSEQ